MNRATPQMVNIFETGLFTVSEVSRLTGVHTQRISRWVRGYPYRTKIGKKWQTPIWEPETPQIDGSPTLSFNDLLEVRFVDALRKQGIPFPKIRKAVLELRKIVGHAHPFSHETVFALGGTLITDIKDDDDQPLFIELIGSRQTLFCETTIPDLTKGYRFQDKSVASWFPDVDRFDRIIVNPRVLFGTPVIEGTRLSTDFMSDAFKAEGSYKKVAYWYEINPAEVQQAVEFHRQYRAA